MLLVFSLMGLLAISKAYEVYGCPVTGCYGSNNTFPCPDVNCQNCHMETGTCQGCKPGYMYQGHRCELGKK
uniref:Laminin EGF-like domain-containing protein n=1 Tax=Magallana gigas TaxID=29159 RepID=A0A8W8P3Q0_MAGGI